MKTRVTTISNLIFTLTFCLALQSCNKEDFFEKEYLGDPNQDERDGRQGGSNSGNNGNAHGGANGNAQGGASNGGQTAGGQTTGGTDGSVTGGGSDGGVDGSATTGGSTGGVDGSTTSGGQTTGGVDGSTSGGTTGSTTGGTAGGSTGGNGNCNIDSNPTISSDPGCKSEIFRQNSRQTKKLDIVWVIDNSGSMADEQIALGSNFSAFIDDFITKDVDFKMAITTTDTSTSTLKGRMVTGSDTKLTSERAKANETLFKADFTSLVRVGVSGSGFEKGLEATEGFMQKYASTFLRPDAYLAVVILSDEEDQSPRSVSFYTDYLKSFKNEAGLVKIYTIADVNKTNSGYGITTGADRYIKASDETAGVVANIRDDFHRSLTAMGDSIINLLDSFALANDPVPGTLRVYVNGIETTAYTFDTASRSIRFNQAPSNNAEIRVYYIKQ